MWLEAQGQHLKLLQQSLMQTWCLRYLPFADVHENTLCHSLSSMTQKVLFAVFAGWGDHRPGQRLPAGWGDGVDEERAAILGSGQRRHSKKLELHGAHGAHAAGSSAETTDPGSVWEADPEHGVHGPPGSGEWRATGVGRSAAPAGKHHRLRATWKLPLQLLLKTIHACKIQRVELISSFDF